MRHHMDPGVIISFFFIFRFYHLYSTHSTARTPWIFSFYLCEFSGTGWTCVMWKCLAQLLAIEQVLPVGQKVKQLPPQMERRQKSSGMGGSRKKCHKKSSRGKRSSFDMLKNSTDCWKIITLFTLIWIFELDKDDILWFLSALKREFSPHFCRLLASLCDEGTGGGYINSRSGYIPLVGGSSSTMYRCI